MVSANPFTAFEAGSVVEKSRLLPVRTDINNHPVTCCKCSFINHAQHNFCTNCGYPVRPRKEHIELYNARLNKRKLFRETCNLKICQARNALYLLAACSMLGIFYLFSDFKLSIVRGAVMVILGLIYAGLGRWSLHQPFTSLFISLMIMLTFLLINAWAEFGAMFTTGGGFYLLVIQIILIHFLLQGVKSAFHANILQEEFKL